MLFFAWLSVSVMCGGDASHDDPSSLTALLKMSLGAVRGSPGNHGNGEQCEIGTLARYIHSTSFRTEHSYDKLYVAGWFGVPHSVDVFGGNVLLWSTDDRVTNTGWEICCVRFSHCDFEHQRLQETSAVDEQMDTFNAVVADARESSVQMPVTVRLMKVAESDPTDPMADLASTAHPSTPCVAVLAAFSLTPCGSAVTLAWCFAVGTCMLAGTLSAGRECHISES